MLGIGGDGGSRRRRDGGVIGFETRGDVLLGSESDGGEDG
jgi:hypothetical protein